MCGYERYDQEQLGRENSLGDALLGLYSILPSLHDKAHLKIAEKTPLLTVTEKLSLLSAPVMVVDADLKEYIETEGDTDLRQEPDVTGLSYSAPRAT